MKFVKMHGAGNDYIYTEESFENPSEVAIKVSDRHFGIGGDGLVMIHKSDVADFKMRMFNADGSEGKMCGNAVRCVGKYVYDYKLTDKTNITIETLSGIKTLKLIVEDLQVTSATVDMGKPEFVPGKIPVLCEGNTAFGLPITVKDRTFEVNCCSMGNPHAVIFVENGEQLTDELVLGYGPLIEKHPAFPDRINVEFIRVLDKKTLQMRVYERGSGETLACGTGASAAAVVANALGLTENIVNVNLLGGVLNIEYKQDGTVLMTGPAEKVFEGYINL